MTIKIKVHGEEMEITAEKDVLNDISIWAQEASNRYESLHLFSIADRADEAGKAIWKELVKSGYYN